MGDIKLFKSNGVEVVELPSFTAQIEKSLQTLFEQNLPALLGVTFIKSEHYTGPVHSGRIDTLGIDEDGTPVIIEFKRSLNENVMNQGLYYLNWLLDHKAEFKLLVAEKLGNDVAAKIDWSEPRVICIAGDFTRYDEHAAKQMPGCIELLRYRRYGDELLLIELVHAPNLAKTTASKVKSDTTEGASEGSLVDDGDPYKYQRIGYRISKTTGALKDLFQAVWDFLASLGDDVQVAQKQQYIAFKRLKNFACLEVYPEKKVVTLFLKVPPSTVQLEEGFTRDVTNKGHYGTGDLEVTLRSMEDFAKAQPLLRRSYERQ